MKLSARQLVLAWTLVAVAPTVGALGFGTLPTSAVLGQPLQISIPLRLEANEDLPPDCLSGQVFFADNLQQPGTTSLRLLPAAPGVTDRILSLSTTTRVDEPVVSVELSVGCAAKVVRRFTLLADPPFVSPPQQAALPALPAVADTAPSAEPGPAREPAPVAATTPAASPTPAAPPKRAVVKRRSNTPPKVAAAAPKPARSVPRRAAADSNPQLKLAPLEAGARVAATTATPSAVASAPAAELAPTPAATEMAASAAAAEQAASAASAAAMAARARVDELEASMKKLRAENAATQQVIAGLQAKLARAETEPLGSPLMYALAAALAVLLGAVIWLWRQRSADREAQSWLVQAAAASSDAAAAASQPSAESAAFAPVPTLKAWVSKPNEVDGFDDTLALTRAGTLSTMPAPFSSRPVPLDSAQPLVAESQPREVSVEELIDLEQQAEFFVVLGQDSAAIDLLMGHLRSTAGTSPLPYLKLLEIYKRLGERGDYERLRERFNSRFNVYAPSWETDLLGGRSLEEYPAVIERLQSLWVTPPRAREVLQATLVRPEDVGPDPVGEDSFDLPAYSELMMLYSVVRDVCDSQADEPEVDLMLPIGDEPMEPPASSPPGDSAVFERLLATTSMPAQPEVRKPLEMDLTLDDIEPIKPPGKDGSDGSSRS